MLCARPAGSNEAIRLGLLLLSHYTEAPPAHLGAPLTILEYFIQFPPTLMKYSPNLHTVNPTDRN
jgi:hypothetical protein